MITSLAPARLFVHGHGSSIVNEAGNDGSTFETQFPLTMRDLTVVSNDGFGVSLGGSGNVLERVTIKALYFALLSGPFATTLRDFVAEAESQAVISGSSLVLDRGVVRGGDTGDTGISSTGSVDITNVIVFGATTLAADLTNASGSISFSTFADSGTDVGSGPRAVKCSSGLTVRSSIVWAPVGTHAR